MDTEKKKKKKAAATAAAQESAGATTKLPQHLQEQKTRVFCASDAPTYQNVSYSGAYMASRIDDSLNMADFVKNLKVEIKSLTEEEMVFDIIGIDPAIANAFRRILIAEVPTMAIEKVFLVNNTSVVQDEVLAHRLGLVPLKVDPRNFEYRTEADNATEKNTIVFRLKKQCWEEGPKGAKTRVNEKVYSSDLEWLPLGSELPPDEETKFTAFNAPQPAPGGQPIAPTHPDIVLAKLRKRHEIELEAHAVKGVGKEHAKWSPVATAAYRLLPEVILKEDIRGDDADELVRKCPVHVFDIEDMGPEGKRATVARPRDCTLCRECLREEGWEEKVALRRVKDHFIFSIESTGALRPEELFTEAITILTDKCEKVLADLF